MPSSLARLRNRWVVGPVRDQLGVAVVLGVLHLAEVRTVEQFLEADDLSTFGLGVVGGLFVFLDHRLLRPCPVGLEKRCTHDVRHGAIVM